MAVQGYTPPPGPEFWSAPKAPKKHAACAKGATEISSPEKFLPSHLAGGCDLIKKQTNGGGWGVQGVREVVWGTPLQPPPPAGAELSSEALRMWGVLHEGWWATVQYNRCPVSYLMPLVESRSVRGE